MSLSVEKDINALLGLKQMLM